MKTMTLTYIGRRLSTSGTLIYAYSDDEGRHLFKSPVRAGLKIGSRFTIEGDEATVRPSTIEVIDPTDDAAAILAWSAEEAADIVLHGRFVDGKRRARMAEDPLRANLDVLAEAYASIPRGSIGKRTAFIDYVNAYIQGVR